MEDVEENKSKFDEYIHPALRVTKEFKINEQIIPVGAVIPFVAYERRREIFQKYLEEGILTPGLWIVEDSGLAFYTLEEIKSKKPELQKVLKTIEEKLQNPKSLIQTAKEESLKFNWVGPHYYEIRESIKKPLTVEELKQILGTTIKRDETNKLITFYGMILTYTDDSQINILNAGMSSTGKTYIPLELATVYFPSQDVLKVAYSSPTAFYHMGKWNPKRNSYVLDLSRKILIFLDQPHYELLERLRPLLSHDERELRYNITDKSEKHGLRTKNVIIRGFPTVIFCSAKLTMNEQEATRCLLLSPEVTQEKIREAVFLKAMKKGNPLEYQSMLENFPERKNLAERIRLIKEARISYVIIRNYDEVAQRFLDTFGGDKLKPRYTRDIGGLISLIQANALLNLFWRERDSNGNIYANQEDIKVGFEMYAEIADSQELGLPPYVYQVFHEVFKPLFSQYENEKDFLTCKEIEKRYYEVYGKTLSESKLRREIIPCLESAGLISSEPDPHDRRRTVIHLNP
jgi:hypothetical protein